MNFALFRGHKNKCSAILCKVSIELESQYFDIKDKFEAKGIIKIFVEISTYFTKNTFKSPIITNY